MLQFVLEEGLGLNVGKEMQRRVFDRFGMTRTSMTWRDDFAPNVADGYDVNGKKEGHHPARQRPRGGFHGHDDLGLCPVHGRIPARGGTIGFSAG